MVGTKCDPNREMRTKVVQLLQSVAVVVPWAHYMVWVLGITSTLQHGSLQPDNGYTTYEVFLDG